MMHIIRRLGRLAGVLAAGFAVAGLLATSAAMAETAKQPAAVAPKAPLLLDAKSTELPPSALGEDGKRNEFGDDNSDHKISDGIKLGNQTLRLDTNRKAIDAAPRVGLDATDPYVLNRDAAAADDASLKPNYFGLTITVPTH